MMRRLFAIGACFLFLLPVLVAVTNPLAQGTKGRSDTPAVRPALSTRSVAAPTAGRPSCPPGWHAFDNPFLGFQAHVPPGYIVRLKEGAMLSVERLDRHPSAAFFIPFRLRTTQTAAQLAERVNRFRSQCDQHYRAQIVGGRETDRATVAFTTRRGRQALEGRFNAFIAAAGSMAFVIGVYAPAGKLKAELPTLSRIAAGFGFTNPRGRWTDYRSPGGGFTLKLPAGWQVETTEGKVAKNEVDWLAYDPRKPYARAFSITPKFCSSALLQHPLYKVRGYRLGVFRSAKECGTTAIAQLFPQTRITAMAPNEELTQLARRLHATVIQGIANLGAGSLEIAVYNCLGEAPYGGKTIRVAFALVITQLTMAGGITGQSVQTDVLCKGWFAPAEEFLNASPVLDRIQLSMAYTPQYVRAVLKAEGERGETIRKTWQEMNRIDQEITRSRWDTQDAVAEMMYDNWRDEPGYVNKSTGRIEKIESAKIVKNADGDVVSLDEVLRGVSRNEATVLRDASSADYMRGVHGRVEFYGE